MSGSALTVDGLEASVGDLQILKGLSIDVPFGEIHAIMGPNGPGKSTLCHVLTGKSGYEVRGTASVDGQPILDLEVGERARAGLLQAFQYPVEVPGLQLDVFITEAAEANGTSAEEAMARVKCGQRSVRHGTGFWVVPSTTTSRVVRRSAQRYFSWRS